MNNQTYRIWGCAMALFFVSTPTYAQSTPTVSALPSTSNSSGVPSQSPPININEEAAPPLVLPSHELKNWPSLWNQVGHLNVDLRVALTSIERAEAATRIAWASALPTLNGNVTLTYVPEGQATGVVFRFGATLQAQLQLSVPLLNLRAYNNIGTAKISEEIARLSMRDVQRRLALNLVRTAMTISSSHRLAELNRIGLNASIERLGLTRKRLQAGAGDKRDLVRAQQDVVIARSAIPTADESLRQARETLATTLGYTHPVNVSDSLEQFEREIHGFCDAQSPRRTSANASRIDVVIAKKQIEVAKRNVDDILLKFAPTLTGNLSFGAAGPAFRGPFTTGWNMSAVLNVPLYDGGVRYGERRDREALVTAAEAQAFQTEINTTIEQIQARRALEVADEALKIAKEARDLAQESERLQRIAYTTGIGTHFDLIDAGRRLREAEIQLLIRELELSRARVSLPFLEGQCASLEFYQKNTTK